MSLDENIAAEIQKLDPSSMIELFELDTTDLGGDIFRFHNGTNNLNQNLIWQGNEYIRFPIQVTGFEISGQGQFPRPTVTVSNILSAITTILLAYDDLIGAKFTRKRTMLKYLDAVNFPGGVNPDADPDVTIPDDIYWVDRKAMENGEQVQFELSSAADLASVQAPRRTVIKSTCPWIYRGADCGFTGVALYDENDEVLPLPESSEALAMRSAFQDLKNAQAALAAAQSDLADKSDALTAAKIYATDTRYQNVLTPTPLAKYYVVRNAYGTTTAYWNDVVVSLGTAYGTGSYKESKYNYIQEDYYEIIHYTRDESAVTAAQSAYDAAVTARNDAQDDLDDAVDAFDTAMAAVPADDPVFSQDRCGKRLTSCKIRFGAITANSPINFGGFPGVSR